MGALSWMLPWKFEVDDRDPFVKDIKFPWSSDDVTYDFYMPSALFWIELVAAVTVAGIFAAIMSIVTYKFVVQKPGTVTAHVVGYGILIPLWIIFPYYQVELFVCSNTFMKFCFAVIVPVINLFHISAAIYGTTPKYATKSLADYALYCGSPILLTYNKKTERYVKANIWQIASHLTKFLLGLFALGIFQSIITPSHYQPLFNNDDIPWYEPSRLWNWDQWRQNLMHAIMFQFYLVTASEGLMGATSILTGYACDPVMMDPVFKSTSPSDFWGRRWNRLIHRALKNGIYLPCRIHHIPRAWAVCASFMASGIFHEWILPMVMGPLSHQARDPDCTAPVCYDPPLGGATAFMLWNSVLVMLEYTVGNTKLVQGFAQCLPRPVRTLCVISLALPVAHWFCEPYIKSSFFDSSAVALPMFLKSSSS